MADDRSDNPSRPVSVGVAVDLELAERAGGHVKCWQRLSEAAAGFGDRVDLTVYFLSAEGRDESRELAPTVRYRLLPARRGTRRLGLDQGGGHTDLARVHPGLAAAAAGHDLLHMTHCFALSRTLARQARRARRPLVMSLHTDVPYLARIYTGEVVGRRFGAAGRRTAEILRVPALASAWMQRRTDALLGRCDHVIVSRAPDRVRLHAKFPGKPVSGLGRGLDLAALTPDLRDRAWLADVWGIPPERVVLVFAGRLDDTKGVMVAAGTARRLRDGGRDVHFLALGAGARRSDIAALMGEAGTAPGVVDQGTLARLFASGDLFVFPSRSETFGNVVWEAKACGLPAVLPDDPGLRERIGADGVDGVIVPGAPPAGDDPARWASALAPLVDDAGRRAAMAKAARADVAARGRSWVRVFEEDLLPVWERLVREREAGFP